MEQKQDVQKKNIPQQTQQTVQPEKRDNTVLIVVLVFVGICFLMSAFLIGAGLWMTKNVFDGARHVSERGQYQIAPDGYYRDMPENIDPYEEGGERNNMYYSEEFGFSLPMQLGWENFKMEEEMLGGDFHIADVNFYLPSRYNNNDEALGYVQMFTISVYVTESWEDPLRDKSMDEMLGEAVGNNDYYTLVYSHLNGDVVDISKQTVQNMQRIIDGIEIFDVSSVPYDDSEYFMEDELNDPYAAYRNNSIYYWNCLHRYSLYYPVTWNNNGPTNMSDEVRFYGDGIDVRVTAYPFAGTIEEFAAQQKKKNGYSAATDMRDQMHGGAHVLAYSYADSYITVLYWKEGDNVMEFKEDWQNLKEETDVVTKMIATLQLNEYNDNCVN